MRLTSPSTFLRQGTSQPPSPLAEDSSKAVANLAPSSVSPKEQPPFYRTYPFVLGVSGLALGAGLGGLTTALLPEQYERIDADGTHHDLTLSYGQYGGRHLREATYNKYKEQVIENPHGGKKTIHLHETGSGYFRLLNQELQLYESQLPQQQLVEGDIKAVDRHVFLPVSQDNHTLFHSAQFHHQPVTGIRNWVEMELSPQVLQENPHFQNMTHMVSVQLNQPLHLKEQDIRHANQDVQLLYASHNAKQAHILLPDGKTLHAVSLNPEGHIIQSGIEGLDGIPVITHPKEVREQLDRIVRDVPSYIESLKAQLTKVPKTYLQRAFVWGAVIGVVGYGLGWALDWQKRRERQKNTLAQ